MKKTFIALVAAGCAQLASASSFVLVIPLKATVPEVETISLELQGLALPGTKTRESYSFDLKPLASITGAKKPDKSNISWTVSSGDLPLGLTLNATTGLISGTPERYAFDPIAFTIEASYEAEVSSANYQIQVDGQQMLTRNLKFGDNTGCALANTGKLHCWGNNNYGQFGIDSLENISAATEVKAYPDPITDFMTGWYHNCVLTTAGQVKCWGRNDKGQLGLPIDSAIPGYASAVTINGFSGPIRSLNAGHSHSCAVLMDGTAECWGLNTSGQLGDGTYEYRAAPVKVAGLSDIAELIAGEYQTCALKTNGSLWCWGNNTNGQLGHPAATIGKNRAIAAVVPGFESGVTSFDTGWQTVCAVQGGKAKCLGQNNNGQLGDGTKIASNVPLEVPYLPGTVTRVHLGQTHGCAVLQVGSIYCWGDNTFGQTGQPLSFAAVPFASQVNVAANVRTLASGWRSSCVELTSDEILCWGRNDAGQLGDGTFIDSYLPRPLFAN